MDISSILSNSYLKNDKYYIIDVPSPKFSNSRSGEDNEMAKYEEDEK